MTKALIGYTGFVGSNLLRQTEFADVYNSRNIADIRGKEYSEIVCAGAPAAMWIANSKPDEDRANLRRLAACLAEAKAERIILISTIAVFSDPSGKDEASDVRLEGLSPYGAHRFELEQALAELAPCTILRLPGLYGAGLKKNVIFDLLNDNLVNQINSRSTYQYYNLAHLWADIRKAMANEIPLLHVSAAPLSVAELALECFGRPFDNDNGKPPVLFDFRSMYDRLWNGEHGYLYTRPRVVSELREFVCNQQAQLSGIDKAAACS